MKCDYCNGTGVKLEWLACDPDDRPSNGECEHCIGSGETKLDTSLVSEYVVYDNNEIAVLKINK